VLLLGRRAVSGPPPVPALQGVTLRITPGETVGDGRTQRRRQDSMLRVLAGIIPLAGR